MVVTSGNHKMDMAIKTFQSDNTPTVRTSRFISDTTNSDIPPNRTET